MTARRSRPYDEPAAKLGASPCTVQTRALDMAATLSCSGRQVVVRQHTGPVYGEVVLALDGDGCTTIKVWGTSSLWRVDVSTLRSVSVVQVERREQYVKICDAMRALAAAGRFSS